MPVCFVYVRLLLLFIVCFLACCSTERIKMYIKSAHNPLPVTTLLQRNYQ